MIVRYSEDALADLARAFDFIAADSPRAAQTIIERILTAVRNLPGMPFKGRPGRRPGTREFVVQRTPYVVVYEVSADEIGIVRILHGAQDWPPK